jgi:thiol-disulfide isomerase/thioredoxin
VAPFLSHGQMRFSETVQRSKTATDTEAALFFVDFWATWCKPCVYASEYLGVLQKQYPDDFYVISLSEENPDIVKRFLEKNPTTLAVAIDYKGETFKAFNTRVLPYGVLINASGKVLWKGSPTDFKRSDVERYLRQNTKRRPADKVIKVQAIKQEVFEADYVPVSDFEMKALKRQTYEDLFFDTVGGFKHYKGALKDIIAREHHVLLRQVTLDPKLNKTYEVYVKKGTNATFQILEALQLDLYHTQRKGDALLLDISNITYWDTNQINWGEGTAEYLIDDSQIQGDNISFNTVLFQLSSVLDLPTVVTGGEPDKDLHDWQIHHKFFNLMQSNLLDVYGITISKGSASYKEYTIKERE